MFLSFELNGVGGNAGLPPAPLTGGRLRGRSLIPLILLIEIKYTRKPGSQ
jgi:hypothetical protein